MKIISKYKDMTVHEAFDFTLNKVEELRKEGVEVMMKVPRSVEKGIYNEKKLKELRDERPDLATVDVDKWRHVSFKPTSEQVNKIFEARRYLGLCGTTFDTGAGCGEVDWELDWSFKYNNGEEEPYERKDLIDNIEDFVKDSMDKPCATGSIGYEDEE